MMIDLPPALPPELASSELAAQIKSGSASYLVARVNGVEIRVYGNRVLSDGEVSSIITSSSSPSEAVKSLTRAYYHTGDLLVKLNYFRVQNTVYVIVGRAKVVEVRGDQRITPHFESVIGDEHLTLAEYDRARALADLKASRIGVQYSVSYETVAENNVALILHDEADSNYDPTTFFAEMNNKGNRYLGRYFASAGVKHDTQTGTEMSLIYQTALVDLGESKDGKSLDQVRFTIDHPFTFGLYGLDLTYVNYEREPEVTQSGPQLCALGICLPGGNTTTTQKVDLEGEVMQARVHGKQVLLSDTRRRITLQEALEYVDYNVTASNSTDDLVDERYGVAELGVSYHQFLSEGKAQFQAGLAVRAGLSGTGTLDTYGNYNQQYQARYGQTAPDVSPPARDGQYYVLLPEFSYQQSLTENLSLLAVVKGQYADTQVPEQEQFVLGGMNSLSAYLPGALIGDEGFHARVSLSQTFHLNGFAIRPALFVEHGQAAFNDASGDLGESESITDGGAGVTIDFTHGLKSEIVVARNISDDVVDENRLKDIEADFFWRLRFEF